MSTSRFPRLRLLLTTLIATAALGPPSLGQQATRPPKPKADDAADAEEERQEETLRRFLTVLEKTPRKGTALDRVYGHHVERGTLDAFIKTYTDRAAAKPDDGVAWMILGLAEGQRGRDAASVEALRKAESTRADDPLPSYYLGQALLMVGQPEEAAAAFERALARKPTRNDMLEIFQALGRVYQRTQKADEALAVWKRLEETFPNDQRVQEQIASALAEEGQDAPALARYEALAAKTTEPFRRVQLGMQAADLKVRLGRSDEALRDFEKLLGQLRPDSWLYREARQKIEEVFLRSDDRTGLAAYYEKWIEKHPEDVDALVRLGRSLAAQGRASASQQWFEKAVKLAPSRKDLRLALIGQLVQDQKVAEAAAQYKAMDEANPDDPDVLREWGALLLHDTSKPEDRRKAEAGDVWQRMLAARPKDPVVAAQVADLFRQAGVVDEALALYRKAIETAPGDVQYHEYMGEYLHSLKRSDEAKAAWAKIAEGPNRNVKGLTRLGEVLAGFGYLTEAVAPLTEAVALDPDEFGLRIKFADLLHKASRYPEAKAQLDAAERLAEKDEEKIAAVVAQVKNDAADGKLADRSAEIRKELEATPADAPPSAAADRWARLARYLEAESKTAEAVQAVERAVEADPRSIPAWTLAAHLRESSGDLGSAADAYRRLADVDRRNRAEYLTGVAKLEARLGRADAALKAAHDLIAAAPGNPEHYQFLSELCFQLGRNDEGVDALRRAVRIDPNDSKIALALAETLAGQFRTEEAVEIYWKAFERSTDLDAKVGIVVRLTDLYLQRNQFDRLLARLQGDAQENRRQEQQRDLAVCLAQAYASSGDLGQARSELERLLAADARDPRLLQQLVKLSEDEGDFESAAKYQKQLVDLSPSDEAWNKLAQLHVRQGDLEDAQAVWSRVAAGKSQPDKVFAAIDSLLSNDRPQAALDVVEGLLRKDPRDWDALYRQGVALVALKRPDEAVARFRALLDMRGAVADDEKGTIAKARTRDPRFNSSAARASNLQRASISPMVERVGAIYQIRVATSVESRDAYVRSQSFAWTPTDYGQARIAALAWTLSTAMKSHKEDDTIAAFRKASEATPADPGALWDWYWLNQIRYDYPSAYKAAVDLSKATPNDPSALWAVLNGVATRRTVVGQRNYSRPGQDKVDRTPPLPADELDHLLACYENLRRRRPEMINAAALQSVTTELKRAKREPDGDRIFAEAVATADRAEQLTSALSIAGERADVDAIRALSEKYDRLAPTQQAAYGGPSTSARAQAISVRLADKDAAGAFRLLDDQFTAMRRASQQRRPGRPRASASMASYTTVWNAGSQTSTQLTFPTPNEVFDSGAIGVLRTAYDGFKRLDLSSDLTARLRKLADEAQADAEAVLARLALSYVLWWDEDKDAAIAEFTRAVERTKADADMRLTLAELLEQNGDPAEALSMVDAVKPLDNATTQRMEEQALRLGILTGDLDRARHAAERLFGLRLDTDTQVRLAGQMGQLGLNDLGEAVLNRARRRAGNKASSLVGLMLQYQKDRNNDAAVQVAQQILRSTPSTRSNPYGYAVSSSSTSPEQARSAAVQVLSRSGRLDELIGRVKEQLATTPNSVHLHQTLADYYKAANRRDEARAELMKVVELRPDDASLRYQTATQLYQEGQHAAAVEQYKAAFKKDPALFGRSYYQVLNAFQAAGKSDELMKLLDDADPRSFGSYNSLMNMVQNMSYDQAQKDKVVPLFRKVWAAFPADRANIMSYVHQDELWKLPEIYDYACEVVLPDQAVSSSGGEWQAFEMGISFSSGGDVTSLISRLLDLASSQNRLEELSKKLEAALAKTPDWTAGKAVQSLVDCRTGRFDDAVRLANEVLDKTKDAPPPGYAPQILGCELEKYGPTRALAVRFFESMLNENSPNSILNEYEYSPIRKLVALYLKDGRKDDARRALLECVKPRDMSGYPDDYVQQMRVESQISIGRELLHLGFAADAAPMLNEAQAGAEAIPPDAPMYSMERSERIRAVRETLDEALTGLKADDLARVASRFMSADGAKAEGKPAAGVQMAVMVYPRELDKAAIRSLLEESLQAAAGEPKRLGELGERLESIRKAAPDDVATAVAVALAALAGGDALAIRPALDRLDEILAKAPLEQLPPGGRANSRQRAEAMRRVPLWLVARACRKSDEWRPRGDALAELAMEAARRQTDPAWNLAMLREQGEQAIRRGDRASAESAWGRMLDSILIGDARKKPAGPQPNQPPGAPPAPAAVPLRRISFPAQDALQPPPGSPGPASPRPRTQAAGTPLLPLERFEQAMQVAKLAADQGFFDLSARAVHESLKGGPPVVVEAAPNSRRQRVVMRNGSAVETQDPVPGRVVARMLELDPIWRRRKAPPQVVYKALLAAVAPEARPADLFLYAQPLGTGGTLRARSVGAMLADWAVRAGETDALLRVAEGRGQQPQAAAAALVLKAQTAFAAGRDDDLAGALAAILDRLKTDTARPTAESAVLAALPALERPAARKPATEVLSAGLKAYDVAGSGGPAAPITLVLARQAFAAGDVEAGRKRLEAYIDIVERNSGVNYGGDYVLYLRKLHLRTVAGEAARAGDWPGALDQFGRFLDAPSYSGGDPLVGEALRRTLQGLATLPAVERYAALKAWTLPNATRQAVRILTTTSVDDRPPASLMGQVTRVADASPADDVWSTSTSLVRSAVEAGKLDELAKEVHEAAERKVENAEPLDRLVALAAGRADAAGLAQARIDDLVRENASPPDESAPRTPGQKPKTFPWNDYLAMRAARASDRPELKALGLRLAEALEGQGRRYSETSALAPLRRELSAARAELAGTPMPAGSAVVDVPGWTAFTTTWAPSRSLWIRHQGLTSLVSSAARDRLAFDYPLSGEFELSLEALRGPWADGGFFYGDLSADPNADYDYRNYNPDSPPRSWKYMRADAFNRVTLKVSPESARLYVNGHLMREDKDPTPTNPWLSLGAGAGERTAWRNVVLKGNPTIPREVRLTHQDRLEGWSTLFYNETRRPRRKPRPAVTDESISTSSSFRRSRPSTNPDDFDWSAEDGVIRGRRLAPSVPTRSPEYYEESGQSPSLPQEAAQSLLAYDRPLRDGDVLTYAFYYEPDQVMVHPALGRTAFLLEPAGVRLHWLTRRDDLTGLSAANVADAPDHRRGEGDLPLKADDWNSLTLTVGETSAMLDLNGKAIYEHPLAPDDDRRFGLYHDKDRTSVQVRDVVLKGRWPESLSDADRAAVALRSPEKAGSEAERRARLAAIGERLFGVEAGSLLAAAPADAEARYRGLAQWVFPSADPPTFRLQGDSSPMNPPPVAGPTADAGARARAEVGGKLRAPALAMVEAAAEAGKLDELAGRVEAAIPGDDPARRGKLALQALVALARGDDAAAEAALTGLKPLLEAAPTDLEEWARWPELVATAAAVERGKATPTAMALLDVMTDRAQKDPGSPLWARRVKGVRSLALLASSDKDAPPADAEGSPWARVTHATDETRGGGAPPAHWIRRGEELAHLPGHGNDYLYLTTPIRGDFQVDCELTSFNWREARIAYAGLSVSPRSDLKHLDRIPMDRPAESIDVNPPLAAIGDWYPYRLVVKGDRMTVFVGDRQVYETGLPAERDPWLAIYAGPGLSTAVRNLKINGSPTVPERLPLSLLPDLTGWRADYYAETLAGNAADWEKRGDEIFGRRRPEFPGSKQESLLSYHRPMLEDGEFSYEFFYDPGRAATHPALDRLTFLLETDGVKVHWMTDGAHDRTGLDPGNAESEPDNRRGPASLPLKEKDWNRVVLEVAGDRATLRLNGTDVYSRAIEPTNQRTFGFFHFADEGEVRVRDVAYSGRWPLRLPASIAGEAAAAPKP